MPLITTRRATQTPMTIQRWRTHVRASDASMGRNATRPLRSASRGLAPVRRDIRHTTREARPSTAAGTGRRSWHRGGVSVDAVELAALGWDEGWEAEWRNLGAPGVPGRVARLDRGWSTVLPGTALEGP